MRKRVANKVLKQRAAGQQYRASTLLTANDKLFGVSNRGMLSFMAWCPGAAKSALEFAKAIRLLAQAMPYFRQTNAELSA